MKFKSFAEKRYSYLLTEQSDELGINELQRTRTKYDIPRSLTGTMSYENSNGDKYIVSFEYGDIIDIKSNADMSFDVEAANRHFNEEDFPLGRAVAAAAHGPESGDEDRQMMGEAKPDYLDMDKDGDKKEPMKKAIKDAEKDKKLDEYGSSKKNRKKMYKEQDSSFNRGIHILVYRRNNTNDDIVGAYSTVEKAEEALDQARKERSEDFPDPNWAIQDAFIDMTIYDLPDPEE